MAKLRTHLSVALVTFLLSLVAHRMTSQSRVTLQNSPCPGLSLRMEVTSKIEGKPRFTPVRIGQADEAYFDGIGWVTISAHEDVGSSPRLVFTTSVGEKLFEAYAHNSDWLSYDDDHPNMNPKLRFTVLKGMKGFPSPLVIAVAMNPGGSDDGWEAFAVGVVDGEFQQLTYEHLEIDDDGGFFFGDLGHGIGLGAAQWNFVWGEDESHPPPHRYEIKIYKWNGRRFEWERVLRTRTEFDCARDAIRALGFNYPDLRASFPKWEYLGNWREMCNRG